VTPAVSDQRARLDRATAELDPPFGVIDLDAFRANAADLVRRAGGTTIRVASKSVRCRELLRDVLALDGYAGILAFTLPEALWLAGYEAFTDVVVGYPTAHRDGIRRLGADEALASRVTVMVDSTEQLDFIDAVVPPGKRAEIRVCVDIDAALRLAGGRIHVGALRSPIHSPAQAEALAKAVVERAGFRLVGLMAYEGQIAGVGDSPPGQPLRGMAIRAMQRWSAAELADRRAAIVDAVTSVRKLEFVNGGGTGSLERTSAEEAVTEIAAGSGLYGPTLFDQYRAFTPHPAALFALSVVRRPKPGVVTAHGGGWIASGIADPNRLPTPVYPAGLTLDSQEGAGEVQTPLHGRAADGLKVGDKVWFRHAKAGELCEHVDDVHMIEGERIVRAVPTYRGEGKVFL
jgi:D-serine deaminase-like pyridoxal phosphate-dependent protein